MEYLLPFFFLQGLSPSNAFAPKRTAESIVLNEPFKDSSLSLSSSELQEEKKGRKNYVKNASLFTYYTITVKFSWFSCSLNG